MGRGRGKGKSKKSTRRSSAKRTTYTNPSIPIQNIEDMATYRKWEAENIYTAPSLRNIFNDNEEAYRQALLTEYKRQRELQYGYIVKNETQKVYNLNQAGRSLGVTENQGVWNGYSSCSSLSEQVQDCAASRIPTIGHTINPGFKSGTACCAITSTAIQSEISAQMGYDGKDNIIRATKWAPLAHATEQCYYTQISKDYAHDGNGKTLNQLIKEGKIGVGDEVSIYSSKSDSGGHAITIADIQYDASGKPQSYTYQSSNNSYFKTIKVTDKTWPGNTRVLNYLNAQNYWQEKINQETQELANLPIEELEAKVTKTNQKTNEIIGELKETEIYASNHHYTGGISSSYNTELAQHSANYNHWLNRTPSPSMTDLAQSTSSLRVYNDLSDELLNSPITPRPESIPVDVPSKEQPEYKRFMGIKVGRKKSPSERQDNYLASAKTKQDTKNTLTADARLAQNEPRRKLRKYAEEPDLLAIKDKEPVLEPVLADNAQTKKEKAIEKMRQIIKQAREDSHA